MNQESIPSTRVVPPSGGKVIRAFGDEITVHLGGAEAGGKYTMFTAVTPPGGGPPPHFHANEVFFAPCAEEFAKPGPPDMSRLVEIAGEHGIYFVNP